MPLICSICNVASQNSLGRCAWLSYSLTHCIHKAGLECLHGLQLCWLETCVLGPTQWLPLVRLSLLGKDLEDCVVLGLASRLRWLVPRMAWMLVCVALSLAWLVYAVALGLVLACWPWRRVSWQGIQRLLWAGGGTTNGLADEALRIAWIGEACPGWDWLKTRRLACDALRLA